MFSGGGAKSVSPVLQETLGCSGTQVSLGMHDTEIEAARAYDRALIIEKRRAAKTNFPLADYEGEVQEYEALLLQRFGAVVQALHDREDSLI